MLTDEERVRLTALAGAHGGMPVEEAQETLKHINLMLERIQPSLQAGWLYLKKDLEEYIGLLNRADPATTSEFLILTIPYVWDGRPDKKFTRTHNMYLCNALLTTLRDYPRCKAGYEKATEYLRKRLGNAYTIDSYLKKAGIEYTDESLQATRLEWLNDMIKHFQALGD